VIFNPWSGRGFVDDLSPEIRAHAPGLGELLTREIIQRIGSGDAVEAYGKAAVVGTGGEIEHASAFIHTLRFGNHFREAVGAKSYLSFTNKRGAAGCSIQIPMMHKDDEGLRSHYLTLEMYIPDRAAHRRDRSRARCGKRWTRTSADRQSLSRPAGDRSRTPGRREPVGRGMSLRFEVTSGMRRDARGTAITKQARARRCCSCMASA